MNNRGFTLVELIVSLTIITVLMLIAVPNVVGILDNNKTVTYVEDAKKMVSTAEYKLRGDDTIEKPSLDGCIAVNLKYLSASEFEDPPYAGKYLEQQSFVIMMKSRINRKYEYYVQLVQEIDDDPKTYRGIKLTKVDNLYGNNYNEFVGEVADVNSLAKLSDYSSNPNDLISHSNLSGMIDQCQNMVVYTTS